MFSDSKIAKDSAVSEDKLRYTIKYGLASHFKGILQSNVQNVL